MKKGILLGMFFLIALLPHSEAIGLSPSSLEIDFEPNLHREISINLINSAEKPLNATLQLAGDLAPYFKVEEGFFVLPPRSVKNYIIVMHLPATIKRPGNHVVAMHAVQAPLQIAGVETRGIGATISVEGAIVIKVPYPGKYAEAELLLEDINEGETSVATLRVINYGLEPIRRAVGILEIYDPSYTLLDTLTTPSLSLPPRQSDQFTLSLDSQRYGPGIFPLTAYVEYDAHQTDPVSKELRIGTLFVNITNTTHEVSTKKITLFEIHVQNLWNKQVENLYGEIKILKDGVLVGEVLRTPSIALPPWKSHILSAFLDATALEPRLYQADITLSYHGKTTKVTVPLHVKKKIEVNITLILVGIIVLMLLLDVIIWILHRRRSNE